MDVLNAVRLWFLLVLLAYTNSASGTVRLTFRRVVFEGYWTDGYGDGWDEEAFETTIALSNNLADYLPKTPSYNAVKMYNQTIPVLYDGSITGTNLVELKINSCNLRGIEPKAFFHSQIGSVNLENNILEELRSGTFSNMAFRNLTLAGNQITIVEPDAFENARIEYLGLNDNNLGEIAGPAFRNASIYRLNASNNSISGVAPAAIEGVTNLNLNDNRMEDISGVFTDLPALSEIYLDNNQITRLNPGVFRGTFARTVGWLRFKNNKIQVVERGVFNNTTVALIDLSRNQITHVEEGAFGNMPFIEYLYLSDNKIKEIKKGVFDNMNIFFELVLEGNGIVSIEPESFKNSIIGHLDLASNNLTEIKSRTFKNTTITVLKMFGNRIRDLERGAFEDMKSLLELDLSYNNLSEISDGVLNISVRLVYLDHNNISKVQGEVGAGGRCRVNFSDNPVNITRANFYFTYEAFAETV